MLASKSKPRSGNFFQAFDFPLLRLDLILLGLIILLFTIGIMMIRSTTLDHPTLGVLPQSQFQWGMAGFVVLLGVAWFDYRFLRNLSIPIYIFVSIWLLAIFVVGQVSFGAQRWISLGAINVQPSELAKMGSLIWMADFFARYRHKLSDIRWLAASLAYGGFPMVMILLQPNLSTTLVTGVVWFSQCWAAGLRLRHLALMIGSGAVLLPVMWIYVMEPYQRARVTDFLSALSQSLISANAEGSATYGSQYNVRQALISVGSGGFWGQGYAEASQVKLRFLKVRHTDFIFSAAASDFGFIGAVFLLVLMGLIIWRILYIASKARDAFGAYICYGMAAVLFFQTMANVGMNLNILPVTGLPFPFLSYGGSSLVTFLFAIGLVESVAVHRKNKNEN
ncbi:MAG TPA: FtsW/RodA/SpoVE family cell cycle protein [Anaerolineales bacterium]|nr:FtsW/RodA/SpoVE family cell cycle protein [Anaerolineales bacterium]